MNVQISTDPVMPNYGGACVTELIPTFLEGKKEPSWIPEEVLASRQVVLFVLDGLGWHQLMERISELPTLSQFIGGPITTVAPSTTAAALTSITTGVPPGEHGLVGYRIPIGDKVLNTLRWSTGSGDIQRDIPPSSLQPVQVFGGQWPPVVTRNKFKGSGFSSAHMTDVRLHGYENRDGLVSETVDLIDSGEPFVYVYWDGIDLTGHEFGFSEKYDAELSACDEMLKKIIQQIKPGVALFVTADHGLVSVGGNTISLPKEITSLIDGQSGEPRFRWLHARQGEKERLFEEAEEKFGDVAWIFTMEEIIQQEWLGPKVTDASRSRLGDVAIAAREPVAFLDAAEVMSIELLCRHGSLTNEEMLVPAISFVT